MNKIIKWIWTIIYHKIYSKVCYLCIRIFLFYILKRYSCGFCFIIWFDLKGEDGVAEEMLSLLGPWAQPLWVHALLLPWACTWTPNAQFWEWALGHRHRFLHHVAPTVLPEIRSPRQSQPGSTGLGALKCLQAQVLVKNSQVGWKMSFAYRWPPGVAQPGPATDLFSVVPGKRHL